MMIKPAGAGENGVSRAGAVRPQGRRQPRRCAQGRARRPRAVNCGGFGAATAAPGARGDECRAPPGSHQMTLSWDGNGEQETQLAPLGTDRG
jgi:hypothetical protein